MLCIELEVFRLFDGINACVYALVALKLEILIEFSDVLFLLYAMHATETQFLIIVGWSLQYIQNSS